MAVDISTIPKSVIAFSLFLIAVAFLYVVIAKPSRFEFAGLGFGSIEDSTQIASSSTSQIRIETFAFSLFTDQNAYTDVGNPYLIAQNNASDFKNVNIPNLADKDILGAFWTPSTNFERLGLFQRINVRVNGSDVQMAARRSSERSGVVELTINLLIAESTPH